MNPCVVSSEERPGGGGGGGGGGGHRASWVLESNWDDPPVATAMSVGLENARQFTGRVDWDWENPTPPSNPNLLLSHRFHHHHHEQSDSEDQKPQITALAPPGSNLSFRQYNGMGLGFSTNHHHQSALAFLNSSGIRNLGTSHDGIPQTSSFHPGLLYSDVSGFGPGGYDSRSQLFGMMSFQEPHNKEGAAPGAVFHDIVKREDVCGGEFQTRIGLNLGHRTYFSAEDTAISRLYKRPRAITAASQVPRCQAEGCNADLSNTKPYHRRHKVCEYHSKASSVVTGGVQQRFCQQCSRFHVLSEFDEVKRSCRKRLADHNRRRRKPQTNAVIPAVSSSAETHTTALKSEGENNMKNNKPDNTGSSSDTRGVQVAQPGMRTESQALMNAMSLPLMLQNSKINPNPNANCSPTHHNNTPVLQHNNSHKLSSLPSQQQQQYPAAQKGPNLSMGLCNHRQTSDYSGLELALPWLRPSSDYSGGPSHHRPSNSPPMDILQPIISEKPDVEGFSSPIQNFLPLSASNSRELGTSQWMVGNSDNTEQHHMFSLLESPAVRPEDETAHQPPVEYLSHRRHQGGLSTKDTVEGTKFSDMQTLRPFGQSIYDASL